MPKRRTNEAKWLRTHRVEGIDRFFHVSAQPFPVVGFRKDTLGEALCDETSVRLLGYFENQLIHGAQLTLPDPAQQGRSRPKETPFSPVERFSFGLRASFGFEDDVAAFLRDHGVAAVALGATAAFSRVERSASWQETKLCCALRALAIAEGEASGSISA